MLVQGWIVVKTLSAQEDCMRETEADDGLLYYAVKSYDEWQGGLPGEGQVVAVVVNYHCLDLGDRCCWKERRLRG